MRAVKFSSESHPKLIKSEFDNSEQIRRALRCFLHKPSRTCHEEVVAFILPSHIQQPNHVSMMWIYVSLNCEFVLKVGTIFLNLSLALMKMKPSLCSVVTDLHALVMISTVCLTPCVRHGKLNFGTGILYSWFRLLYFFLVREAANSSEIPTAVYQQRKQSTAKKKSLH